MQKERFRREDDAFPSHQEEVNDDEFEILLREQDEYFKASYPSDRICIGSHHKSKLLPPTSKPSVFKFSTNTESSRPTTAKVSQFRHRHLAEAAAQAKAELLQMDVLPDILRDVHEKKQSVDDQVVSTTDDFVDIPQYGFPVPEKLIQGVKVSGLSKKSLEGGMESPDSDPPLPWNQSGGSQNIRSRCVISEENAKRIARMTDEEIRLAQEEIVSAIGLDLAKNIRNKQSLRKKGKELLTVNVSTKVDDSCNVTGTLSTDITTDIKITGSTDDNEKNEGCRVAKSMEKKSRWGVTSFNFSQKEAKKLEWTEPIETSNAVNEAEEKQILNLRFDFQGNCQTFLNVSQNKEDTLHHHGDDPNLPGYTLNEIVNYWLSSVQSGQRVLALNCLSAIFIKGMILKGSSDSQQQELRGGFGFGLKNWHRVLFETLELHWKILLSSRSTNSNVKVASIRALSCLLAPTPQINECSPSLLPACDIASNWIIQLEEIVETLQSPSPHRLSLVSWASCYRRVYLEERKSSLLTYLRAPSDRRQIFDFDETSARLQDWFCNPSKQLITSVPILSQFDPILHLVMEGLDLRGTMGQVENATGAQRTLSDSSFEYWPTEIGTLITNALKRYFGECDVEVNCLNLLTALCCHSEEICLFCVLGHQELMDHIKHLVTALTIGTEEYQRRANMSNRQADDLIFIQSTYFVRCALLNFVLTTIKAGQRRAAEWFLAWNNGMTFIVLLRQCLMEQWKPHSMVPSTTAKPLLVERGPGATKVVVTPRGTTSDSGGGTDCTERQTTLPKTTTCVTGITSEKSSTNGAAMKIDVIETCRIHSLDILRLLSEFELWREDQQAMFQVYLDWITNTLRSDYHQNEVHWHLKSISHLMAYLSVCMKNDEELTIFGLLNPLLSIANKLFEILNDKPKFQNSDFGVFQFIIESFHLLSIAVSTMNSVWESHLSRTSHLKSSFAGDRTTQCDNYQQLLYYSSLLETSLKKYFKTLQIPTFISSNMCIDDHNASNFCNWVEECGLYSQYQQFATIISPASDNFLIPFLMLRLVVVILEINANVSILLKKSKNPQEMELLMREGTESLSSIRVQHGVYQMMRSFKCLSFCFGDINLTGSFDVVRSCPLFTVFHDYIKVVNAAACLAAEASDLSGSDLLLEVYTTSTTDQLYIAIQKLLTLWGFHDESNNHIISSFTIGIASGLIVTLTSDQCMDDQEINRLDNGWLCCNSFDCLMQIIILSPFILNSPIKSYLMNFILKLLQSKMTLNKRTSDENRQLISNNLSAAVPNKLSCTSNTYIRSFLDFFPPFQLLLTLSKEFIENPNRQCDNELLTILNYLETTFKVSIIDHYPKPLRSLSEKIVEELMNRVKEMTSINIHLARCLGIFTFTCVPIECQILIWKDLTVLLVLNKVLQNLSELHIEESHHSELVQYKKRFLTTIQKHNQLKADN